MNEYFKEINGNKYLALVPAIEGKENIKFNKVNGYFEEINGNKYLALVPIIEGKEKIEKKYENIGVKSEI